MARWRDGQTQSDIEIEHYHISHQISVCVGAESFIIEHHLYLKSPNLFHVNFSINHLNAKKEIAFNHCEIIMFNSKYFLNE